VFKQIKSMFFKYFAFQILVRKPFNADAQ